MPRVPVKLTKTLNKVLLEILSLIYELYNTSKEILGFIANVAIFLVKFLFHGTQRQIFLHVIILDGEIENCMPLFLKIIEIP